jgi:hypothetical protein
MFNDLRHAVRTLAASPGFAVAAWIPARRAATIDSLRAVKAS